MLVYGLILAGALGITACAYGLMIWMPGASRRDVRPELTPRELELRTQLRQDVSGLAGEIGERNLFNAAQLHSASRLIEAQFSAAGFDVRRQPVEDAGGQTADNLEVEVAGSTRAEEIVVIGAHYDSVIGSPGANDNATGVAAMLALARAFARRRPARTLRFVAFVNEEPPFFLSASMGSLAYARRSRDLRERVTAMLSLETLGYYSDRPGSQQYPFPLRWCYPSAGTFIAFIGNVRSRRLVHRAIASFRRGAHIPSEGAALPAGIPGVGWSDHWAFWQAGYPAIMVTDTAPYRYPHYHSQTDTPDRIDYDRLARVVAGLEGVVADLAQGLK